MPKKASFGKIGYRYFIGSKNNENVIRVRIKKGKKWIERSLYYTQIQSKFGYYIEKVFDSKPVNKNYVKTKMKSYNGRSNTGFHGDRTRKDVFIIFVIQ